MVTHKQSLMIGARSFLGNPYDGHGLKAPFEQTGHLLQDLGRSPKQVIVNLDCRGVYKSLNRDEKRLVKRREAIEPLFGNTKSDHQMDRCWLQGATGDALHPLSRAAGYNIRWLLRATSSVSASAWAGFLRPVGCVRVRDLVAASDVRVVSSPAAGRHATAQAAAQSFIVVAG